jgi:hypothetical protein
VWRVDVWTRVLVCCGETLVAALLHMCEMLINFCDDFELFSMTFSNYFCDEMNVLPMDEPGQPT